MYRRTDAQNTEAPATLHVFPDSAGARAKKKRGRRCRRPRPLLEPSLPAQCPQFDRLQLPLTMVHLVPGDSPERHDWMP